jgi:hypothetical protein
MQGWRVALPNPQDPFPERSEENVAALVAADQSLFPAPEIHEYKYEHPRAMTWHKRDNQPCYNCGKIAISFLHLHVNVDRNFLLVLGNAWHQGCGYLDGFDTSIL